MSSRGSRLRSGALGTGVVLGILALAVPPLVAAANITVSAIPGAGWIQAPDNTAGRTAVIVASPVADLGVDSVRLVTTGTSDFVGIGRSVAGPLSGLTGGSWQTFATGTSGLLVAEPASLRFGMYRLGGLSEFTTMTVERVYNGTVTAGVWQANTLTDTTMVYQTNATGAFCLVAAPCTFAAFKTQYPNATLLGLQVAIGTGIPATTSYVDGVSLTVDGVTDTWDFELAAAASPSAAPSAPPSAAPSATSAAVVTGPPTDLDAPPALSSSTPVAAAVVILGALALLVLVSVRLRRSGGTS